MWAALYHQADIPLFVRDGGVQMQLDQDLVDAARELLERRFPGEEGIAVARCTRMMET
jgi:hypothetical protein